MIPALSTYKPQMQKYSYLGAHNKQKIIFQKLTVSLDDTINNIQIPNS